MKKIVLFMVFALVCSAAWAIGPRRVTQYTGGDQVVTTNPATLYEAVVSFENVTKGDKMVIRNGDTVGETAVLSFVADDTDGTIGYFPPIPVLLDEGLYLDAFTTTGGFTVDLKYID